MKMPLHHLLKLCFLLWAVVAPFHVADGVARASTMEKFTGIARNSNGRIEYTEKHEIIYEDGRVVSSRTTYFDPENQYIGHLFSDYSMGYQFGSYDFSDVRGGRKNGAKVEADTVRMYSQNDPGDEMHTKELPRMSNQIVGQGFHHFIVNNLETIASGAILPVRMVLPAQLDHYRFRIRRRSIDGDIITIRLEIDNWFLRLFAPHIDTVYHLQTGRLLRYQGVSNLKDASGAYKGVTIEYQYDR